MKISRRLLPAAVLLLLTTAVAACDGLTFGSDDIFEAVGTVGFWDGEGGCWTIQTDQDNYDPINLPDDLKKDGLRIRFEAQVRDDLAGFCPGEIVELRWIERV